MGNLWSSKKDKTHEKDEKNKSGDNSTPSIGAGAFFVGLLAAGIAYCILSDSKKAQTEKNGELDKSTT